LYERKWDLRKESGSFAGDLQTIPGEKNALCGSFYRNDYGSGATESSFPKAQGAGPMPQQKTPAPPPLETRFDVLRFEA